MREEALIGIRLDNGTIFASPVHQVLDNDHDKLYDYLVKKYKNEKEVLELVRTPIQYIDPDKDKIRPWHDLKDKFKADKIQDLKAFIKKEVEEHKYLFNKGNWYSFYNNKREN